MKKQLCIAFLLATIFFITGCGEVDNISDVEFHEEIISFADIDLYGLTLTISNPWEFQHLGLFARLYMEANPGVNIVIDNFGGFPSIYMEQAPVQLMAGVANDMLESSGFDHRNPSTQALLVDWFPLMLADPHFNEDDFFMNVFESASSSGRLYNLPQFVSFQWVTGNDTVPGVVEMLQQHTTITMNDLLTIHQNAITDTTFYIHQSHDVYNAVILQLDSFMDFDNRIANFNTPEFIDFITVARVTTPPNKQFGWTFGTGVPDQAITQRYLFQRLSSLNFLVASIYEEQMSFSNPVLVANNSGQLLAEPFSSFLLNGQTSPEIRALAWDFMRFMYDPEIYRQWDLMVPIMPIYRPLLRHGLERELQSTFQFASEWHGLRLTESPEDVVEWKYAIFNEIGHMPMVDTIYITRTMVYIFHEVLEQFHNGLITAEQTATYLQNRISLVLMELG